MNNELPTFATCKELAKYLPMETERYIDKDGTEYHKKFSTEFLDNPLYPAPLLSELLRVSPLWIEVDVLPNEKEIHIMYYDKNDNEKDILLDKSDNLTEQVAQVILQYYKQKENV